MSKYDYGQKEPMENEAMVRTLDTQARAIWPQEKVYLKRIFDRPGLEVLDVGCGTGEISSRVAAEFSPKRVTGIDLAEPHIRRAQERFRGVSELSFQQGDANRMAFEDDRFDVSICRHMLQAVPEPLKVIKEMIRVTKTNGWLYALAEDYGMLFFHPTKYDTDEFFGVHGNRAAAKAGSDLRQGRPGRRPCCRLGRHPLHHRHRQDGWPAQALRSQPGRRRGRGRARSCSPGRERRHRGTYGIPCTPRSWGR